MYILITPSRYGVYVSIETNFAFSHIKKQVYIDMNLVIMFLCQLYRPPPACRTRLTPSQCGGTEQVAISFPPI